MNQDEYKKTSSNVAYVGLDLVNGHTIETAMHQIHDLKKIKPVAWFVDIVYNPVQLNYAVKIKQILDVELSALNPWEKYGGWAVNVELNPILISGVVPSVLKARQKMNDEINVKKKVGQAEHVKFRDPTGKELPIEY